MAIFKPFRAVRPAAAFADKVAALPYDVMNSDEARKMAFGNPYSFLHVDKAEIDLPKSVDIYDEKVYLKAKENLGKLISADVLQADEKPCLYIYQQVFEGRTQTGLVGCASVDDYLQSVIKKHEFTRADKEADRIRHVDTLDANTGPIFLTYRKNDKITDTVNDWMAAHTPEYDFVADSVSQTVWVVDDEAVIAALEQAFADVSSLYIADGHHRCASAVKVGEMRRKENPDYTGDEEFNFFLAVAFADADLKIMDYNRVVKDLNGLTFDEFIEKISGSFEVSELGAQQSPSVRHSFSMYYDGKWYLLTAKQGTFDEKDPVGRLDVSILQNNLLDPVLGIKDPKNDDRIDFIGGIRGLDELERRADSDMKIAFAMYPTTVEDLMSIADAEKIMPPKSTWFEPKLLSGLFIHHLS